MPTGGRLAAAILYAALFWAVSQLALPLYPLAEEPVPSAFTLVNIGVAIIFGWRLGGLNSGRLSWGGAVSQGLTTLVATTFAALLLHGGIRMVQLSLRKVYDGPGEAVIAVFGLMIDIGRTAATAEVITLLVVGSIIVGLMVEWVGRRFG